MDGLMLVWPTASGKSTTLEYIKSLMKKERFVNKGPQDTTTEWVFLRYVCLVADLDWLGFREEPELQQWQIPLVGCLLDFYKLRRVKFLTAGVCTNINEVTRDWVMHGGSLCLLQGTHSELTEVLLTRGNTPERLESHGPRTEEMITKAVESHIKMREELFKNFPRNVLFINPRLSTEEISRKILTALDLQFLLDEEEAFRVLSTSRSKI